MGKVKMMRCLEECGKQWRTVQEKSGWEKQKEKEKKQKAEKKTRRKREEKEVEERKNGRS